MGTKNHIPYPIKRLYYAVRNGVLSSSIVLDILYKDKLTVTDGDIKLKFDTSSTTAKRWFYPRYRDGSMHEPVVAEALQNVVDPNSVFFDIGANIGFYTVLGAKICSEIHSFEMDPRLASIVSGHLDLQNTTAEVQIVPAPVGDKSGKFITFSPHQTNNLSTNAVNLQQPDPPIKSNFRLQTVALDDYIKRTQTQPDVLKIDVEGFELSVLEGLSETLEDVRALLIELHPELLGRYGSDTIEVLRLLDEHGFKTQRFTDHRVTTRPEDSLEPIDKDTQFRENGMVLCTK